MIFTHLLQSASLIPTDASALESSISALETAISALEAAIRALESRSVSWEYTLPWFTFAVLAGVAMEWWVIRHDFREEIEIWAIFDFIGVIRFPSRPSVRKLLVEITSVALIVFGIFGELAIGLEIASINSSLRAKSAELRSKNAELRSKSDRLVALLNSARVKLEAKVAWRRLSKEQQSAIADHLTNFEVVRIGVSYLNGEAEGLGFSNDIAAALHAAQWNVFTPRQPFTQFGAFGGGIIPLEALTGVNVSNTGSRLGRDAGDAIQRELCSLGFDTTITRKPQAFGVGDPKIDVEILVVGRPPTQQGHGELKINNQQKANRACSASE